MRRWKCSVCGYIHIGNEPPEICPVCGADRSKFFEINAAGEPISSSQNLNQEIPEPSDRQTAAQDDRFAAAIFKLHVHPISVHIPNGLLPITVFFTFLSFIFLSETLNITAHYNMMVVLLAMPLV
ncbi:MAG: rubredoxin-like domain-containing protein, partial [Thermodesulfobacteriota bacterium]